MSKDRRRREKQLEINMTRMMGFYSVRQTTLERMFKQTKVHLSSNVQFYLDMIMII